MSRALPRRSILRLSGLALSVGLGGCSALGGGNGLDVILNNGNSESHTISIAVGGFEDEATLDPGTSETFTDVLSYPDHPTETEAIVEIDEDWEDTETFTLGTELKAFVVNVGDEKEVSYTLKGR